MKEPLTQEKLDKMGCSTPDCDHKGHDGPMYLHPACHEGAPTISFYANGSMYIKCAVCHNLVAAIAVDPGTTERH